MLEWEGGSGIPALAGCSPAQHLPPSAAPGSGEDSATPLHQGHRKTVTTNFNKNKIKIIKPFISFRDYLFAAGWSKQSQGTIALDFKLKTNLQKK